MKNVLVTTLFVLLAFAATAQDRHKNPPVINRAAIVANDSAMAVEVEAVDVIDSLDMADSTKYVDDIAMLDSIVPWDVSMRQRLTAIAANASSAYYNTGICVWDLTADTLLFAYNANKVMRPASTQKVMTAVTALALLGYDHEFQTRTYYTGNIAADGTLTGDIYVVGDFDPMYTLADLKRLATAISEKGVRRISGKVYADASMKSDDLFGNGWCWDDVPCTNQPYLCALMLERGKESPRFKQYSKDLYFNPALDFVKALCDELGRIGIKSPYADNPSISYAVRELPTKGATLLHTQSHTVLDVLHRMMKNSDNLHAEAMFFQVANTASAKRCTWKHGAARVNEVLARAGGSTSLGKVADGSGVSLYNYVTPSNQVAMLRYAYRRDNIFPYLYDAMPIAGKDGTLESRMRTGAAFDNVRAKTGTVEGVSCLAGYVTASNGNLLAFSIMNNGVMKSQTGRRFQDRVCQELAR